MAPISGLPISDPQTNIFVAADPLMNTPAPMSRSIEFKRDHIALILRDGWAVWERDRRPGKSKSRPTAELDDFRTEILIGGRQDRFLDLVMLERIARGLDPGERHLVADKLKISQPKPEAVSHALLTEFGVTQEVLFDWEFRFALTTDLEPHKTCPGRIANMIGVAEPIFSQSAEQIFDRHYRGGI